MIKAIFFDLWDTLAYIKGLKEHKQHLEDALGELYPHYLEAFVHWHKDVRSIEQFIADLHAQYPLSDQQQQAILEENVRLLQSIKGIGAKTAQRVIIDLKDKIGKTAASDQIFMSRADNTIRDEALSALVMLGFARKNIEKELDKLLKLNPDLTVEETIKMALKSL